MALAAPETDQPIPFAVWRLAGVIVFGAFMSGLDASVINVGLDSIARDLNADLATAQWAANAYLLALGVSLPVCGWLGRRVGVGRLWLIALGAFTVASVLCALAPTIGWLISLRIGQGMSAGLLIPAGQTILGQAVGPGRLGRVMSILGVAVTAAPAIGPVVGGIIVDTASWPWLFLLNLPIGALGLGLGWRYIPRGNPEDVGPLDRLGLVMLTVGLPLVVYGITSWGERRSFAATGVAIPLVVGLTALGAYVRHSRRVRLPVLDLALFRNRSYAAASATAGFTGAALFGAGLLFPLYFLIGRGEGTIEAGLLLISISVGTIVMLPYSGRLVDRYGGGPVSLAGGIAAVLTTVPFALLDLEANPILVQVLLFMRGAAVALSVLPAGTAAYKAVTLAQLPDATTQINILQRLGGALGGSVFAVVLATRLPAGAESAFHAAFACLTVASAAGVLAAVWLTRSEQAARRDVPPTSADSTSSHPSIHPARSTT